MRGCYMIFKPPKNKPELPKPNWFKWGLLAFILLILIQFSSSPDGASPSLLDKTKHDINQSSPNLESYSSWLPARGGVEMNDITAGKGPPPLCGQQITLTYQLFSTQDGTEKALHEAKQGKFTIGSQDFTPFLAHAITKMRIGSKRSITLNQPMKKSLIMGGHETTDEPLISRAEISLTDATPKLDHLYQAVDTLGLKVFPTKRGQGEAATCGQKIRVAIHTYDNTGKRRDKAARMSDVTLGQDGVVSGLEQGMLGMQIGEKRTIIVPPDWHMILSDGQKSKEHSLTFYEVKRLE